MIVSPRRGHHELPDFVAELWNGRAVLAESGGDQQGVMGSTPRPHQSAVLADARLGGGALEAVEELTGAHALAALAQAAAGRRYRVKAIRENCRSASIFSGTAEESASMWKKSIDSAMAFSMTMWRELKTSSRGREPVRSRKALAKRRGPRSGRSCGRWRRRSKKHRARRHG